MTTIAIVQVACPDLESAQAIARALLDEHLIACANIAACDSIYRWQGAIETADEVLMQVKTTSEAAPIVAKRIAALHPYELPAIERWAAETDEALGRWIAETAAG